MNSVLEELWYGNIVPNENMGLSKEMKENMKKLFQLIYMC